jgi:hypothetical protein
VILSPRGDWLSPPASNTAVSLLFASKGAAMNVRIWNLQKREYEQAEVVSISEQSIMVRVGDREFPVQPRDVDPDDRNRLTQLAPDLRESGQNN